MSKKFFLSLSGDFEAEPLVVPAHDRPDALVCSGDDQCALQSGACRPGGVRQTHRRGTRDSHGRWGTQTRDGGEENFHRR